MNDAMTDFALRDAAPDDAAAIAEIYAHYVLTTCITFEETVPSAGEIRARMQKVLDAALPWYVAEAPDRTILGYAYAAPFHPRSAYRFTVENAVYVDSAHLRRGIGSALMQRLIAESARRGFRQMVALIGDTANEASIRLHEKLGFRNVGVLTGVGFKFDRWLGVPLMQLPLGENAAPFA
jgi:phosphinothricin acetyltransferase